MPRKPKSASRPMDVVFNARMENAYQTALNLIEKTKRLARHRALRHDGGEELGYTLNRFIDRVAQSLTAQKVKPGTVTVEKEESLKEFLAPET